MRIARVLLAFLAACVLLALLLVAALEAPPGRRYLLRTVSGALRARGIDFHASTLQYNLFTLRATPDGVVVRSAAVSGLPPVALIPRVTLTARWADLLRGTIAVEKVTLERPAIHIVIDREGRDNIPRLEGGGGATAGFFLGQLTARDGTLRVEDRRRALELTLPWQLEVVGRRESGALALHLAAGPGSPIRFDGRGPAARLLPEQRVLRRHRPGDLEAGPGTPAPRSCASSWRWPRARCRATRSLGSRSHGSTPPAPTRTWTSSGRSCPPAGGLRLSGRRPRPQSTHRSESANSISANGSARTVSLPPQDDTMTQ